MLKRLFFSLIAIFGLVSILALTASAQTNWVWQGGSTYSNAPGFYGKFQSSCNSGLPPGRTQNAYWVDKNGNFWVYGGFSSALGNVYLNDLWEFNTTTLLWTWQGGSVPFNQPGSYGTMGSASASNQPGARVQPAFTVDASGNLWLFGGDGLDANGVMGELNDFWEFNTTTLQWTWQGGSSTANPTLSIGPLGVASTSYQASGRQAAALWIDQNNNFWIFGGFNNTLGTLNDVWEYQTTAQTWTWQQGNAHAGGQTAVYSSSIPASVTPASDSASVYWSDTQGMLWLFSGVTNNNELWSFNPLTELWTFQNASSYTDSYGIYGSKGVAAPANIPGARGNAIYAKDANGRIWFFGGSGLGANASGSFNDLSLYDPTSQEWTWLSGYPMYSNLTAWYGSEYLPNSWNYPGSRASGSAFIDAHGNFWLFGGEGYDLAGNYGELNDVWEFTAQPSAAAPSFSVATGSYQPGQTVALSSGTSNALIFYTTDGSTPTTCSNLYSAPIPVLGSQNFEIVNAIAVAPTNMQSQVVTASYTALQSYTWNPPTTTIVYGNNLSGLMNATSNYPGSWTYFTGSTQMYPSTVLPAGQSQLDAIFMPAGGGPTHKISIKLTVNKAPIYVSAGSVAVVYNSQVLRTYPYTISGFVNNDSPAVITGTPAITPSATTRAASSGAVYYTANVGNYSLNPSWGSLKATNYSFVFLSGGLSVVPSAAYLTVQPNNLTVKYGAALPTLCYKITGLLNWDTAATQTVGAPQLTLVTLIPMGSATKPGAGKAIPMTIGGGGGEAPLPRGTYQITSGPSTLTQTYGNYAGFNYGSGTLTVY
jgi:hypothetical protein